MSSSPVITNIPRYEQGVETSNSVGTTEGALALRAWKEAQGLTNKQLAAQFGVSEVMASFLCTGVRPPQRRLKERMERECGIPRALWSQGVW